MKQVFEKLSTYIRRFFIGLAVGMKKTEDATLKQAGAGSDIDNGIHQQVSESRVSKDLLRGEVTQEVEDLRWRTILIDKEARNYDYFSPVLAMKIDTQDKVNVSYENSDNLEVITIQHNSPEIESVDQAMKRLDSKDKVQELYTIKVERNGIPRYRIEQFTTMLVVKDAGDNHGVLDFYVSKYPNPQMFISKGFVREVEKIMNEGWRSDMTDIRKVMFMTRNAYKVPNSYIFSFRDVKFDKVVEYDGHYVLKFNAEFEKNGIDMLAKFYSERIMKKYETHAPKQTTIDYNPYREENIRTYTCAKCGKTVRYSMEEMDALEPTDGREIDEVQEDGSNVTEFMDAEISEVTFGKKLCKECLAEEMAHLHWTPYK